MAREPIGNEGTDSERAVPDTPYIGTERAQARERQRSSGNDGGDGGSLDGRISKLEVYVEVSRDDLREIRADMKAVIGRLGNMPTKSDLDTWKWQWLAASVAIFALAITSILAGLSWLSGG